MSKNFAIVICFSPAGAINGKSVFGKVGPFKTAKETEEWCSEFRMIARQEKVDMTALSSSAIQQLTDQAKEREYLPSKDANEIIRHARVPVLFGIGV